MIGHNGERHEGIKEDLFSTTGQRSIAKHSIGQYLSRRIHKLTRGRCSLLVSGQTEFSGSCSSQNMRCSPLLINVSHLYYILRTG